MTFLVSVEFPGKGSFILGYMQALDQKSAQREMAEKLVSADYPRQKIGIQVVDSTVLEIGINKIHITPIQELDMPKILALAAFL